MYNRRKFLETAALSSAFLALNKNGMANNANNTNLPIVISTWDFGIAANADAWKVLKNKGKALDAVEKGVMVAEADINNQTVGYGGLPDRDGIVTLDACIMNHLSDCGSVMAIENIKHPISVARLVMEKTPHIVLAGDGARQFALEQGFKSENLLTEKSKKDWQEWLIKAKYEPQKNIENKLYQRSTPQRLPGNQYNHDTIGMLALDSQGNMAGACTTSGMAYKIHGRVGDSPIIGAGLYVDGEVGGAVSTGVGEEVIRNVGTFLVVELMRQGYTPLEACTEAVHRIVKKNKKAKDIQVGFLALDKKGNYAAYALQEGFSYAVCNQEQQDLLINSPHYF